MNISLIISVYKNALFLKTVLDALHFQTVLPDEIIVSEDGDSPEMRDFLLNYDSGKLNIVHLTQADQGWQKNKALNRAIVAASYEYLIFIDGDCVPHTRFIQNHLRLSHPVHILAGKRVKLGPLYSEKLRHTPLPRFQQGLVWQMARMQKDGAKFAEEGLYFPLNNVTKAAICRFGISSIKGCNFSCYKAAILAINGFDEDYVRPAVGEDDDLVWRFQGLGYQVVSVKHFAIQYHLYHAESWTSREENVALLREKQASGQYRCLNGIEKLSS
ncbi:glycosyltransferase [Parapedobacter sp. DT-150]|uniref:glycosyltransferase n=1 Tax=Parapedobacter sp. DT-150 TaxID=3396162 RepID=UPI003F1AB3D9